MADHADHLRVHELLRHRGADLRVGLVVLGDQRELDRLAVDLDAGGVGLVDREARAVLVVLAEVRDAAGERPDVADLRLRGGLGSSPRLCWPHAAERRRKLAATAITHDAGNEGMLSVVHGRPLIRGIVVFGDVRAGHARISRGLRGPLLLRENPLHQRVDVPVGYGAVRRHRYVAPRPGSPSSPCPQASSAPPCPRGTWRRLPCTRGRPSSCPPCGRPGRRASWRAPRLPPPEKRPPPAPGERDTSPASFMFSP